MSVSSFPRSEHISLLRRVIEERLRARRLPIVVADRGLNQLKCQYRFGFRMRAPGEQEGPAAGESQAGESNDRVELPIHFQVAERLEEGQGGAEFAETLDRFLARNFPELGASAGAE